MTKVEGVPVVLGRAGLGPNLANSRRRQFGKNRPKEAFLFGKLLLRQPSFAQTVENTIADFINSEMKDSRDLFNGILGTKFQS